MKSLLNRILYWLVSPVVHFLHASGICAGPLLLPGLERLRWAIGRLGAWIQYQRAARRVPAYREFLAGNKVQSFNSVPFTDKENYVKVYSLDHRCVGVQGYRFQEYR